MLGARLTVVDFLTTILMRWSRNMPRPVDSWPALAAYARRMKSTAVVQGGLPRARA